MDKTDNYEVVKQEGAWQVVFSWDSHQYYVVLPDGTWLEAIGWQHEAIERMYIERCN